MSIFKSKTGAIIEFLKGKDWTTLDDIALGTDLSKSKARTALFSLKYKKAVEQDGEKWRLYSKPEAQAEETTDTPPLLVEIPIPPSPSDSKINLDADPETLHKGLNAKVSDIEKKLDLVLGVKPMKEKRARLKKFNVRKIRKFNKGKSRAVIILQRNHNARLIKGEAVMGMIRIGENYYDGGALYTWLWEGKQPCYIMPEWSVKPLAADELYKKAVSEKCVIDSQVITLRAMKLIEQESEDLGRKKGNMMLWIGIGIAAVVVGWLFLGGKK